MKLHKRSYLILLLILLGGLLYCSPPVWNPEQDKQGNTEIKKVQFNDQKTETITIRSASLIEESEPDPPGTDPGGWLQFLAPVIVLIVTQFVKIIKKLPGWVIVVIVVPLTSALLGWLATLVINDLSWLQQFLYGLASIILFEMQKQLRQGSE